MKQRTERDSKNSFAFNARPNVALIANQTIGSVDSTDDDACDIVTSQKNAFLRLPEAHALT
jgi:hypothetical protein